VKITVVRNGETKQYEVQRSESTDGKRTSKAD
jgi:hypothetical protein